jgi:CyaY protein
MPDPAASARCEGSNPMHDESEFIAQADRTLAAIGRALDAATLRSDADVDWTLNDGILDIDCGAGGRLIVNRHVPTRQIWLAARTGGFHFAPAGDAWRDTRSGDDLAAALAALIRTQAGLDVAFALPTASSNPRDA